MRRKQEHLGVGHTERPCTRSIVQSEGAATRTRRPLPDAWGNFREASLRIGHVHYTNLSIRGLLRSADRTKTKTPAGDGADGGCKSGRTRLGSHLGAVSSPRSDWSALRERR